MTVASRDTLVDRLRGKYVVGDSQTTGCIEWTRVFKTPPICHEAADEIARLTEREENLMSFAVALWHRFRWEVESDAEYSNPEDADEAEWCEMILDVAKSLGIDAAVEAESAK